MSEQDIEKAQKVAGTIPCACSDCGMDEPRATQMIMQYAAEEIAAKQERLEAEVVKLKASLREMIEVASKARGTEFTDAQFKKAITDLNKAKSLL